jgi:choloylglycine hydrolase
MITQPITRRSFSTIGVCAMLLSSAIQSAQACTGIRLIAEDGTVVHAQTMEFAIDIHSDMMTIAFDSTGKSLDSSP